MMFFILTTGATEVGDDGFNPCGPWFTMFSLMAFRALADSLPSAFPCQFNWSSIPIYNNKTIYEQSQYTM